MNFINKILTSILCMGIIIQWLPYTYAQDLTLAKTALQSYFDSWFSNADGEEWLLEVNGIKLPSYGMEVGLNSLNDTLQNAKISNAEKKQVKSRFIQSYLDQSMILALSYQDLINNPDLDVLLQEFLRQAATQLWLENQIIKNPSAIEPTEDELNSYYLQHSERLLRLGLSASQIKEYTEQELKQKKVQEWTEQQIAAVKSSAITSINPKMKKKYDI